MGAGLLSRGEAAEVPADEDFARCIRRWEHTMHTDCVIGRRRGCIEKGMELVDFIFLWFLCCSAKSRQEVVTVQNKFFPELYVLKVCTLP